MLFTNNTKVINARDIWIEVTLPLSTNASLNVSPMLTNRSGIKSDQSLLRSYNQINSYKFSFRVNKETT